MPAEFNGRDDGRCEDIPVRAGVAAWAGLVPKQTGLGGKVNLHGISKRGDM
ncbi:hypothetical protein CBM2625_U60012 [Cupriavidus taiwanensis]|nr:hypothetical protein CBM2625_U60012 [Cupriavidus taiwanensis]